jgi:hypothetical protein
MAEEMRQMKILTPKVHGVLDYVVVAVFLIAPHLFGFSGGAALLSYAVAAVHLALTVATDFPLGAFRLIPLTIHGWIELAVAPTLAAVPFILGFGPGTPARYFFVAAGGVVFATWLVTDYRRE